MAGFAVPYLGDPDGVCIGGVFSDDVAEQPGISAMPSSRMAISASRWAGAAIILPISPYISGAPCISANAAVPIVPTAARQATSSRRPICILP